jgi:hypothetical protein
MYSAHCAVLGKTLGHWVSSLTATIEANNNAENIESVVDDLILRFRSCEPQELERQGTDLKA